MVLLAWLGSMWRVGNERKGMGNSEIGLIAIDIQTVWPWFSRQCHGVVTKGKSQGGARPNPRCTGGTRWCGTRAAVKSRVVIFDEYCTLYWLSRESCLQMILDTRSLYSRQQAHDRELLVGDGKVSLPWLRTIQENVSNGYKQCRCWASEGEEIWR